MNEEKSLDDNTKKKEEDGKSGGGAKNMKELLEKIYGARTKAAAETSVGKDYNEITCCLIHVYTLILQSWYAHICTGVFFLIIRMAQWSSWIVNYDQTNFVPPTWSGGYTAYRDSDSRVILDVDEEREAMRRAMEVEFI